VFWEPILRQPRREACFFWALVPTWLKSLSLSLASAAPVTKWDG
jgi:hypothetical protein